MKVTAVIVCAGSGTRMGGNINKVFMPLGAGSVIDYTVKAVSESSMVDEVIIVTRECDILECMEHIKNNKKKVKIIKGGSTRQESVYNGLIEASDADIVAIHDGARALITTELIDKVISAAKSYSAAACGVPEKDSLKLVSNGFITSTLDRTGVYKIQTPQCFAYDKILYSHQKAREDGMTATDDCALYEKYIGKIKLVEGDYENIKLTTPDDMITAENILKKRGSL